MSFVDDIKEKKQGVNCRMLREFTKKELEMQLTEVKKELMIQNGKRFNHGNPENIRKLKKTKAKIMTILHERSYAK